VYIGAAAKGSNATGATAAGGQHERKVGQTLNLKSQNFQVFLYIVSLRLGFNGILLDVDSCC